MAIDLSRTRLEELRRRIREEMPLAELSPAESEETVQFVVRMPASLRAALHQAADGARSPSTQAWVIDVLEQAVATELSTADRLSGLLPKSTRAALRTALVDGSYDRWVAKIDDPELHD